MDFNSSAEKMMMRLIEKIVPAETVQMLQPDKVRGLITVIGQRLNTITEQQNRIEQNQQLILDILNERRSGGNGGNAPVQLIGSGSALTGTDN